MKRDKISFFSAVSIGIGGMIGGGIFAVLGLAVQMAAGGTFLSFLIGGFIALVTSYSYAKLSITYPSPGGTVEFLNKAFGTGVFAGGLNILLWLSYIVMLSLYAYAFGSYGASFFSPESHVFWRHVFITGIVILMTFLNLMSSKAVGEAEEGIVAFKIGILLLFIIAGLWSVNAERLTPERWSTPLQLISGGMIIFLAYEGFELIANTAGDVKDIKRLPLAFYTSVGLVILIYFTIAIIAVGNLPYEQIVAAEDYALAAAAKPFLGSTGFILIAIAALLSTSSAINATLYGSARICYIIAKEGELPPLEKKVWNKPVEGLLITSGITMLIANLLDLTSISTIGSAGFLLIFAFVNLANVRLSSETGSRRVISLIGTVACTSALIVLLIHTGAEKLGIFAAIMVISFAIEYIYRKATKREIVSKF